MREKVAEKRKKNREGKRGTREREIDKRQGEYSFLRARKRREKGERGRGEGWDK